MAVKKAPKKPYQDEDLDRLLESMIWQLIRRDPEQARKIMQRVQESAPVMMKQNPSDKPQDIV